jgi:hypothetical protein
VSPVPNVFQGIKYVDVTGKIYLPPAVNYDLEYDFSKNTIAQWQHMEDIPYPTQPTSLNKSRNNSCILIYSLK